MASRLALGHGSQNPRSWLIRYITLQKAYDLKIDKDLLDAIKKIESEAVYIGKKSGIGSRVRRAQLTGSRVALHRAVAYLWRGIGNTIRAGAQEAAALALEQSFDWDEVLLRKAYPSRFEREAMRAYLVQSASRGVEALVARVTHSRTPLSTRVYYNDKRTQRQLEVRINSALARGASAADLAKDVRGLIDPRTSGGVSYAAKRLARTEINNAYHAMTVEHNKEKPWVTGMIWALSKSHPKPDICNLIAMQSPYPRGKVPAKPHPQCLCYAYPELMSVEEFQRRIMAGEFEEYIENTYTSGDSHAGKLLQ